MLKRESIKKAIDAIAAQEKEIGYTLIELFDAGRISPVDGAGAPDQDQVPGNVSWFTFDDQFIPVKNINLFREGTMAIEPHLLICYGEMAHRQTMASKKPPRGFSGIKQSLHHAGLRQLVRYEIELACSTIKKEVKPAKRNADTPVHPDAGHVLLHQLRAQLPEMISSERSPVENHILFSGAVDADTSAHFCTFPFSLPNLIQIADLDLTYFSVRFVLHCLINGTAPNLLACLVDGGINGLAYIGRKSSFAGSDLEIKYIASARDARPAWLEHHRLHRGVGIFLIAGVWLLWKHMLPDVRRIVLDSERGALPFYKILGFKKKRPYVYTLTKPEGYLLNALAVMVDRSRHIDEKVIRDMLPLIPSQIRRLTHRRHSDLRDQALGFIQLCLLSQSRPLLARTAAMHLLHKQKHIPEAGGLLQLASCHGRIELVEQRPMDLHPLLIFRDEKLQAHLEGIFHVEQAGRLKAVDDALKHVDLTGKWKEVNTRPASLEELAWIHTPDHIARIAATAGRKMTSLDLDTQTTQNSYAVARLAVGGVFMLLDKIMSSPSRRGFAAVRPPGHHAEPDKAMGFCLFNNVALAAAYLKHNYGLKKVMIVDIDAHHGNGTQKAFFHTKDVLYASMHQFPCYPGTGNFSEIGCNAGEGFTVNVPLKKAMGDREFLLFIHRLVSPLACAYEPEIILVSCGFDLYQHELLVELNGTPEGYAMITRQLCHLADTVCNGRIAFVLEGGYNIQGIRQCSLNVFKEMCGIPVFDSMRMEKILYKFSSPFSALGKTMDLHKKYWTILDR